MTRFAIVLLFCAILSHAADDAAEALAELDARFPNTKVEISLAKDKVQAGEPIVVKFKAKPAMPWSYLGPENLRVQDEHGNVVNLFTNPVSGNSGGIRSKVWYDLDKAKFDLSSFADPYSGMELVNRFAPGTYRVTYHHARYFSGTLSWSNPRDLSWGKRTSNTVTFRVEENKKPPDIGELIHDGEKAIEREDAQMAVDAFKRAVIFSKHREQIENIIMRIMRVRFISSWDSEMWKTSVGWHPPDWSKLKEEENFNDRLTARAMSCLHIRDERERQSLMERWSRWPASAQENDPLAGVSFFELCNFPQYRTLLERAMIDIKTCKSIFLEAYLYTMWKNVETMGRILKFRPEVALSHFSREKAPRELVPIIVGYFSDETPANGIWLMDYAFAAIQYHAGIERKYHKQWEWDKYRKEIRAPVEEWWSKHRAEYENVEKK